MEMDLNDRILNHIILASGIDPNPGLLDGKMGIVLLLGHYSKLSGNKVYDEIAGDMLDEIWDDVHHSFPVGLASGLCGIGWGIEYLIRNGFMEGDADEVCEEIDRMVGWQKIHPEMDRSLATGLEGILHYVMARIGGNLAAGRPHPFDPAFLDELYGVTKTKRAGIFGRFNRFYTGSPCDYRPNLVELIPARIRIDKKNLANNPTGLRGLAGYLFKQLFD